MSVREKLIRLKNNHAVKFDVREGLMAPILADALSPPSIFTEINTNVGEPGVDEAKQDFVRLVTNAVKVDLSA